MSAQVFDLARHRECRQEPLPADPGDRYNPVFAETAAFLDGQLDKLAERGGWPDLLTLWIERLDAADRLEQASARLPSR